MASGQPALSRRSLCRQLMALRNHQNHAKSTQCEGFSRFLGENTRHLARALDLEAAHDARLFIKLAL